MDETSRVGGEALPDSDRAELPQTLHQALRAGDDGIIMVRAAYLARICRAALREQASDPTPALIEVTREDGNNYCRILTLLGMEEEGDPVAAVERLLASPQAGASDPTPEQAALTDRQVRIDYTNWKGQRGFRLIVPAEVRFAAHRPYHYDEQWLLRAWDFEKKDMRDFAMRDIHSWQFVDAVHDQPWRAPPQAATAPPEPPASPSGHFRKTIGGPNPFYACIHCGSEEPGVEVNLMEHLAKCPKFEPQAATALTSPSK